ncbi:GNAT family N-acetyltransferase [Methylobrevis albus]|uniref:N-acetyltransferase n=1 Tax=Methylobrevis albus TaxID=2793297 RepID=A0A931I6P3_9HYPH|nr:GNAT family N-acetyltransferase [Methylobrevis albus]MBH0239803.1 N-acetyltransferase [Methylobrevis albus]
MPQEIVLKVETSLAAVDRDGFDAVANPGWHRAAGGKLEDRGSTSPYNPFVCHDFLTALEISGCATGRSGWLGQHLLLEDPEAGLLAAAPLYLKNHSQGEYVFDHGWADAYERAGGRYYPKLQLSVPFTPATGPRLLVGAGSETEAATRRAALAAGVVELARRHRVSSVHATFLETADAEALGEAGFVARSDRQFHWTNAGYGSYADFLGELASRKRKALRKEREAALAAGIEIEWVTGADLTEAHWDAFHAFYVDTGSRKWGRPYLNRRFFSEVSALMADRILLVMAKREGRYIAGALNFIGSDTLYGRNWGCIEEHPFLHFEVCYHQAIDFAIAHGLARVEAGAQGEHKLARGYLPATTHSAHWIADPGFREAVADYLVRERAAVAADAEACLELSPFRRGDG